jgi:hypothetical protein
MERTGFAGHLDQCTELLAHAVEESERLKSTLERTGMGIDPTRGITFEETSDG